MGEGFVTSPWPGLQCNAGIVLRVSCRNNSIEKFLFEACSYFLNKNVVQ